MDWFLDQGEEEETSKDAGTQTDSEQETKKTDDGTQTEDIGKVDQETKKPEKKTKTVPILLVKKKPFSDEAWQFLFFVSHFSLFHWL